MWSRYRFAAGKRDRFFGSRGWGLTRKIEATPRPTAAIRRPPELAVTAEPITMAHWGYR